MGGQALLLHLILLQPLHLSGCGLGDIPGSKVLYFSTSNGGEFSAFVCISERTCGRDGIRGIGGREAGVRTQTQARQGNRKAYPENIDVHRIFISGLRAWIEK